MNYSRKSRIRLSFDNRSLRLNSTIEKSVENTLRIRLLVKIEINFIFD